MSTQNNQQIGGIHAIPDLAPQWKRLDLSEILSRKAAFVSISQNNSVYQPWGAQGSENHRVRGSLEATVKVVEAAAMRRINNFFAPVISSDAFVRLLQDNVKTA